MIAHAATVRDRLAKLASQIEEYARSTQNVDQPRYARTSGVLVRHEERKLAMGLSSYEDVNTLWALRSVVDMMKDLVDIGSDIREVEPSVWQEAQELATLAHDIERHHHLNR